MLEGAEEAAIKQIAEDDEMYNTGKEWVFFGRLRWPSRYLERLADR